MEPFIDFTKPMSTIPELRPKRCRGFKRRPVILSVESISKFRPVNDPPEPIGKEVRPVTDLTMEIRCERSELICVQPMFESKDRRARQRPLGAQLFKMDIKSFAPPIGQDRAPKASDQRSLILHS
ncbi:hypothetical protein ASG25_10160 [Rhizobium sp. Leaf384]|nr:hypothetical protein ASG25_10160 [Rhizobium sp. Leaf384]KQS82591.1 hypothetical protein ASG58_04360 [Rhizobium sp. Leaf383]